MERFPLSFVSLSFPIFFAVIFVLYYLFPRVQAQNALILVASLVFYGFWDWRFLPLLLGTGLVSYSAALLIERSRSPQKKKLFLWLTIAVALSALGFFKYFDFFTDSALRLSALAGIRADRPALQIVLPLGISFMTFQGLAYVIDVYRGDQLADPDLVRVLAFKTFFPQLVAGPIERAKHLLIQFSQPRTLAADKVGRAIWLLIYGYAMKIAVADSLGQIVNSLFVPGQIYGWSVVLGSIAFGIQIYADFCGYSLIAKGAALLFGFDLIWNFRFPYWSISPSDFWRRWHIGLSNWLRDYLYIPLGGSRSGKFGTARNLLITMSLGGLWHGASWNFVLWGLFHGLVLAAWRLVGAPAFPASRAGRVAGWAITMIVVFVGWSLFRASDWNVLQAMTTALGNWEWAPVHSAIVLSILAVAIPIGLLEWFLQSKGDFALIEGTPAVVRYAVYSVICVVTASMVGVYNSTFIYFQF